MKGLVGDCGHQGPEGQGQGQRWESRGRGQTSLSHGNKTPQDGLCGQPGLVTEGSQSGPVSLEGDGAGDTGQTLDRSGEHLGPWAARAQAGEKDKGQGRARAGWGPDWLPRGLPGTRASQARGLLWWAWEQSSCLSIPITCFSLSPPC